MRAPRALPALLALICTGCGVERPAPEAARTAVTASLAKFGDLTDYAAGRGRESTKPPFPDVYWVIPFRATVKLRDDIYWEAPGGMRYRIGNYDIPGKIVPLSDFTPRFQSDLRAGKARDPGGRKFTRLAAGSLYVCDGKAIFKLENDAYKLEEVQQIRRGTCTSATPCYVEHGISDPTKE